MVVDLPEPFGPRNPVTIPGCTTKFNPSTASLVPYRLLRFSTSIMVFAFQALMGDLPRRGDGPGEERDGMLCRRTPVRSGTRRQMGSAIFPLTAPPSRCRIAVG